MLTVLALLVLVVCCIASYRWGYDQGHCDAQSDIADDCDIC